MPGPQSGLVIGHLLRKDSPFPFLPTPAFQPTRGLCLRFALNNIIYASTTVPPTVEAPVSGLIIT